jgi:hypothetical protein
MLVETRLLLLLLYSVLILHTHISASPFVQTTACLAGVV